MPDLERSYVKRLELENVRRVLAADDKTVGPACMNVTVPPTIRNDCDFREAYSQGYRHALADVREVLRDDAR